MHRKPLRLLGHLLLASSCCASISWSKDEPQPPLQKPQTPSLEAVLDRLERVERELTQLKQSKGQNVDPQLAKVAVVASDVRFDGQQYVGGNEPMRVLSAKVTIFNLTNKAIEVPADLYTLTVAGTELKSGVPPVLTSRAFSDGFQTISYNNLKTNTLKLAPGEFGQTPLVFSGLAGTVGSLRPLVLTVRGTEGQLARVDLLEQAAKQSQITIERIGPRKALALVTINGPMTGISSWSLVSRLEELLAEKVARVVVTFGDSAPQPNPNVWNWLQYSATNSGINDYNDQTHGQIPNGLAEFHVVNPQTRRSTPTQVVGPSNQMRVINGMVQRFTPVAQNRHVHNSVDDAITDALGSIFQVLPRDELLAEIQSGSTHTRVAALANGGGRLGPEELPLIIKLANDNDVAIQKAAIRALRHFGDNEAIDLLVAQAKKNSGPISDVAIESLAGSRFTKAHEALLDLLKNEPMGSRKTIVQSLGRFARPIWAETLYGFVEAKDSGVRVDALKALTSIGHPKLVELLEVCLNDSDKVLSESAFAHLAIREDAPSEKLAVEWTLKHLEKSPPTMAMRDLLFRTKEQRAIPLLLKQIERPSSNRPICIEVLAQIGDQTVIDRFVQMFDKIDSNEKRIVLQTLQKMQSPVFRDMAAKALDSSDYNLLSNAVNMLQQDGTPQAGAILVKAFKTPGGDDNRFHLLCYAMSNVATVEARAALFEAAEATPPTNVNRQNVIKQAIRNLQLRSPAQHFVAMGRHHEEQKQIPQAMQQYDLAIKSDPDNSDARLARGNLLMKDEKLSGAAREKLDKAAQEKHDKAVHDKLDKAAEDFKKFIQLDPTNSQGPTSLAIIHARQGKLDEAEKILEDTRERFKRENLFLYNASCLYGRCLEHARSNEKLENREERLKKYEQRAIEDLKAALAVGLDPQNRNWAKEDPDLKSLHENEEFKNLILTK